MTLKNERKEIDLLDVWRIAIKRKWIIITLAALFAIAMVVVSFTRPPTYRATARILIEEPNSGMVNIQDLLSPQNYYSQNNVGTYFNTQLKLLTSRTLAEKAVAAMNIDDRAELYKALSSNKSLGHKFRNLVSFKWIFSRKKDKEQENSLMKMAEAEFELAQRILKKLEINPVEETRLIDINYKSRYPDLAADVVNTLAEEFINYSIEMRYAPTQQASEFLAGQIAQLRRELDAKERDLQKYGKDKGLLVLNREKNNTIVQSFQSLAKAYSEAQLDRFKKEAKYLELKGLSADTVPLYIEDSVLQSLRASYIQTRSQYNEKLKTFKPDYPEMKQLRGKMDSLYGDLQNELRKAVNAARSDYNEAKKNEQSLKDALETQKQEVYNSNNNAILYQSLNIEVQNMRNLLNTLVQKKSESQVSARLKGMKTSNIKIIDRALIPKKPVPLNIIRNLILAIMFGIFLGGGIAFFTEYLDNTIRDPEEIEKAMDLPSLGIIPYLSPNGSQKTKSYRAYYSPYSPGGNNNGHKPIPPSETREVELINHLYPNLSISEDYRTIRTSIMFSHAGKPPKVVTFSSSFPQEGKSATISNLAVSFAQLGKKVLLIDADLRRPRLHKIFKAKNTKGLSNYLTGKIFYEEAVQITAIKNLWLIPSGPIPPNPAELLDSEKMEKLVEDIREKYDIVLIDSPPVLAVIDAAVLGSMSDSLVIVVKSGKTTKKALANTVGEIRKTSAKIIGVVYNEVKSGGSGSFYSPSYQGYMDEYYQAADIDEKHV